MELKQTLSRSAFTALRSETEQNPVLTPSLLGQITTFNRQARGAEPVQAEAEQKHSEDPLAEIRQQVLSAIDRFEQSIDTVIGMRRSEERAAKRWIVVVGLVLIVLVLGSAVVQLLPGEGTGSWITTLLSGVSVVGLLSILYSPVTKLIEIANDRSALLLLPATYRLRVLSATSQEELSKMAKELYDTLQAPT